MLRVFEACLPHYHGRDREVTGGAVCQRLSQSESGAGCLPVGLVRTGGGLVKGWQGLVEDEEDWWKRNGVIAKT